ncbi:hypothetical protein [Alloactinosynnema sp. L-07]|uniref:DUF5317 family protein n=1 Tax=Alloactinosynnema sp. L-07 TaxID=1653480 RepID=UPI00065EFB77|nr:DUF5317 family protein [Alloactinosynnema sp. L-07]CRK58584.1 hypothetical protein [Alloactinosynnema sp. L-07]
MPVALGVACGLAAGGRVSALANRFTHPWLLWATVGVQTAAEYPEVLLGDGLGKPTDMETPRNEPADENTRLKYLTDVVPIPLLGKIVSGGDLLIVLGLATLVARGMRADATAGESTDRPDSVGASSGRGQ